MNKISREFALILVLIIITTYLTFAYTEEEIEVFSEMVEDTLFECDDIELPEDEELHEDIELSENGEELSVENSTIDYYDEGIDGVAQQEVTICDTSSEDEEESENDSLTYNVCMTSLINDSNLPDESQSENSVDLEDDRGNAQLRQCVSLDNVTILVDSAENAFPESTVLHVEPVSDDAIIAAVSAAFELNSTDTHHLYRIELFDAAGIVLPGFGTVLPTVRVDGLNVGEDTRVAVYDSESSEVTEIENVVTDSAVVFSFKGSMIYDIVSVVGASEYLTTSADEDAMEESIVEGLNDGQISVVKMAQQHNSEKATVAKEEEGTQDEPSIVNDDNIPTYNTGLDYALEAVELSEDDSAKITIQDSEMMAANATQYIPQSRTITMSGNSKTSINLGDTLEVHVSKTVKSWHSSRKRIAIVAFDGEKAIITARKPGKVTLTAKLSTRRKIKLMLTVKDPYLPNSVHFSNLSSHYIVGESVNLNDYITLEPSYATSKITWKSSNKKVVKISKGGVMTALKAGSAKIIATTRNKRKCTIKIKVVANNISGLYRKPTKGEVIALGNAFSIWPKSLSHNANGKLIAEFYLLNGSKHRLSTINGITLSVFAGDRNNQLASQYFSKVKVRGKKKGISTFKVTFSSTAVTKKDLHLTDYTPGSIFFDLQASVISARAGRKIVPFTATVIPNLPDNPGSIALEPATLSMKTGNTAQLTVSQFLADGETPIGIEWGSTRSDVASVDSSGLVTANSVGKTVITATLTSQKGATYSASCDVTVNPPIFRALLIGEGTFKGKGVDSEGNVIEDNNRDGYIAEVEKLQNVLSSRRTASGTDWIIQTRFDRSASEIRQDIRDALGSADEADVSLFFIATHGDTKRAYKDAKASRLACYNSESYIKTKELAEWLSEVRGKVIILIEACGSGGFIAESPSMTYAEMNESPYQDLFDPELFNNGLTQAFMDMENSISNCESYNASLFAGDLRDHSTLSGENKFYVLTSSAFQELSFRRSSTQISFFVEYIVDGVDTSGNMPADVLYGGNGDEKLTLSEMYNYISAVGDNQKHKKNDEIYYQHVQVYPANSGFVLFTK